MNIKNDLDKKKRMSGEEDEKELELKDLIVQTLEANGLLSKIKVR